MGEVGLDGVGFGVWVRIGVWSGFWSFIYLSTITALWLYSLSLLSFMRIACVTCLLRYVCFLLMTYTRSSDDVYDMFVFVYDDGNIADNLVHRTQWMMKIMLFLMTD